MAQQGWIKLHRCLTDHYLWQEKPFDKARAWIDLLLLTSHKDTKFLLGNELIVCPAGTFITSERKLAERWGWSRKKVSTFLQMLEDDTMIVAKRDTKRTTITIEKWGNYQSEGATLEPQKSHVGATKEPRKNTIKNDKEIKNGENVKNIYSSDEPKKRPAFTPPSVIEVREYCISKDYHIDAERFVDFYEARGWMLGKSKMKDWKAAVRTWVKNDKERNSGMTARQRENQAQNDVLGKLIRGEEV